MELFQDTWRLDDLDANTFGDFAPPRLSDLEKREIWDSYDAGRPTRVPVFFGTNDRVAVLDDRLDTGDFTYESVFSDPRAMLTAALLHTYVRARRYSRFSDDPSELPDEWHAEIGFQNTGEAWGAGCPVRFHAGQVPDTVPIFGGERKHAIFDVDIDHPLDHDPYKRALEFFSFLAEYVKDKTFLDRPIVINPPANAGTDGPLTVAMNIRGPEILMDMVEDTEYAHRVFDFLVDAALKRRQAFRDHFGLETTGVAMADDSIAMISVEQYREMILPHHRRWYDAIEAPFGERSIHLCGDATRHFPTLKNELGVTLFDTGFPVDFGALRRALGPECEIFGGVEVHLLLSGAPGQIYSRARDILASGIMEGGRFKLREANNLPPNVPWSNLAAMYKAALDFGRY